MEDLDIDLLSERSIVLEVTDEILSDLIGKIIRFMSDNNLKGGILMEKAKEITIVKKKLLSLTVDELRELRKNEEKEVMELLENVNGSL